MLTGKSGKEKEGKAAELAQDVQKDMSSSRSHDVGGAFSLQPWACFSRARSLVALWKATRMRGILGRWRRWKKGDGVGPFGGKFNRSKSMDRMILGLISC